MTPTKKKNKGGKGRPKGMRVVFCTACRRRVTGFPRTEVACPHCETVNRIPEKT